MFAEAIKQIRASAGLSQKAFGESIGACQSVIGLYENRKHKISAETWERIAGKYHDYLERLGIPAEMPTEERRILPPKAEALREVRENFGLTQKQFAESIGVTKSVIGNYESGQQGVSDRLWAKAMEKYSDVLQNYDRSEPVVILQSSDGQEITTAMIMDKVTKSAGGNVNSIYVRADHNAAYWVREEETGKVELWASCH